VQLQRISAAAGSAADAAANKATLDYDTFLTLLVQQMKNQDPTEPMDSTEQIAQLATFSQVEQTIQTNKNLENLLQSSSSARPGRSSDVPSPAMTKPFRASLRKCRSIPTGWLPCLKAARRFWSVPA
jgi:hypothetical protein